MQTSCLYCLAEASKLFSCTNTCLLQSNISPVTAGSFLGGGILLSIISVLFALAFKNDIKKVLGFRLLGIASLATTIFTVGFVFNGHLILKNLPILIPTIGIGSYIISYFFSFYFIKTTHKSMEVDDKKILNFTSKISKNLNVTKPSMYKFISKEPRAFLVDGNKKAIFLSNSLIERLDSKSLKAVILHELYHLKRRSGMLKNLVSSLGNLNFRLLPVPIEEFEQIEEKEIDKILMKRHRIDINKIRRKIYL